jgi:hypothetical protein
MAKQQRPSSDGNNDLLRRMSAKSDDVVDKVVKFANNDVPDYLRNLRQFEKQSLGVTIIVK